MKVDWADIGERESLETLLLTAREVAQALRVSVRTVQIMTGRGELPCVHLGRLVRYDIADIKRWIGDHKTARGTQILDHATGDPGLLASIRRSQTRA